MLVDSPPTGSRLVNIAVAYIARGAAIAASEKAAAAVRHDDFRRLPPPRGLAFYAGFITNVPAAEDFAIVGIIVDTVNI